MIFSIFRSLRASTGDEKCKQRDPASFYSSKCYLPFNIYQYILFLSIELVELARCLFDLAKLSTKQKVYPNYSLVFECGFHDFWIL